jgi:hypothetical protein
MSEEAHRQSQKGASAIDRATASVCLQTAIEAMTRAIEDEERSQGSVHAA